MADTPEMQDYLKFMEWLQVKHPGLYIVYWKNITIPADGEKITIVKDGMSQEKYEAVVAATKEYYGKENNS